MGNRDLATQLEELLAPSAHEHGTELVAVEQTGGRGVPIIRVLLDREGGIDIESLTVANDWISNVLDSAAPLQGPYTLEVSSPGVDRPLRSLEHFERFCGETAVVKVRGADGVRSSYTGTIVRVEPAAVVLLVDGEEVAIPFGDIQKARLKGVVDFGKGGPK